MHLGPLYLGSVVAIGWFVIRLVDRQKRKKAAKR